MTLQPWQDYEDLVIKNMLSSGISFRVLAREIGRSESGVRSRAKQIGAHSKFSSYKNLKPSAPHPMWSVSKDDLPIYYARGWRISSFSGDRIFLEWPHPNHQPWRP